MKIFVSLLILFLIISCTQSSRGTSLFSQSSSKPIIILQPLCKFSGTSLKFLKDSIEKFYQVKIVIASSRSFPPNTYYSPRKRYRADSTIAWLKSIKADSVRSIVGLTNFDISTTKGSIIDYGIMGLGFQPGNSCIVSDFRLKKDHPSEKLLQERLFKTVVHEIGHNFGLPHCSDKHCIMADAEGKLNQDNETVICNKCRAKLKI